MKPLLWYFSLHIDHLLLLLVHYGPQFFHTIVILIKKVVCSQISFRTNRKWVWHNGWGILFPILNSFKIAFNARRPTHDQRGQNFLMSLRCVRILLKTTTYFPRIHFRPLGVKQQVLKWMTGKLYLVSKNKHWVQKE